MGGKGGPVFELADWQGVSERQMKSACFRPPTRDGEGSHPCGFHLSRLW